MVIEKKLILKYLQIDLHQSKIYPFFFSEDGVICFTKWKSVIVSSV